MNNDTISIWKWFWAWQDEKEEAWLGEKAAEGLHLESISPFGIYHFKPGKPGRYIYRLDFQTIKAKDRESYLQLFEDAGWEHIGDMGGWVYFRHPVNGTEIPEIFSDLESKIGKYQRLMLYLVIFLPILILILPGTDRLDYFGPVLKTILVVLQAALMILYSYAMLMLINRVTQLKKNSR